MPLMLELSLIQKIHSFDNDIKSMYLCGAMVIHVIRVICPTCITVRQVVLNSSRCHLGGESQLMNNHILTVYTDRDQCEVKVQYKY